ncbi:MAG: ATP-dependent endonuclease [Actinomycetota bacterium]|nr:ATP-dependent endonuclease [Actinomycetota bacterium]
MRVAAIDVKNFRLLHDVDIRLDPNVTIVVGPNNSGKTSLIEVFFKFLGTDRSALTVDDFSVECLVGIRTAGERWIESVKAKADGKDDDAKRLEEEAVELIPGITLNIELAYEEADDLAPIAGLIMDLDPTRHDALVSCRYEARRPLELLKAFGAACERKPQDLVDFLRKKHGAHFVITFWAIDKCDEANTKEITRPEASNAVATEFIYAQNQFDDTSSDKGRGLSKGFESYYKSVSDTAETTASLEDVLTDFAEQLDSEYVTLFKGVFDDLRTFGAERMPSVQELKVISEMRAGDVLAGSTRVVYEHSPDIDLPESHNGLGYSKLIFMILQFIAFFEAYRKRKPQPGMEIIFVEEPEAHLHPQMQTVFIKNVSDYIRSKDGWNVQLVVTTHSSHIVAESGFCCIRYFDNSEGKCDVRDLSTFRNELEKDEAETLLFLEQYMVLSRCDMFFADKVILIEGTAERLVLPAMIRQSAEPLQHQYISVVEVGGAYALKFKRLLEFLNVQTLIITDIDSVSPDGRHPKVPVATAGALTSNSTLKSWLPGSALVADLLAAVVDKKVDKKVRIAYQIPETGSERCGRSFEEAFILANADALSANSWTLATAKAFLDEAESVLDAESIRAQSYAIAGLIDSKSDFAFDAVLLEGWTTPLYIAEGLQWLASLNK